MSFLLRAFLVVAALTYLARQQGTEHAAGSQATGLSANAPTVALPSVPAIWEALPASARERVLRDGSAEFTRRLVAASPSRDTLGEADRQPSWRGSLAP